MGMRIGSGGVLEEWDFELIRKQVGDDFTEIERLSSSIEKWGGQVAGNRASIPAPPYRRSKVLDLMHGCVFPAPSCHGSVLRLTLGHPAFM